jgi:hypothetical protein
MVSLESGVSRRWRAAGLAVIAACVWLLPASARAQSGNHVTIHFPTSARVWNTPFNQRAAVNAAAGLEGAQTSSLNKSLEAIRFDSAPANVAYGARALSAGRSTMAAKQVYAGPPRRMYSRDRSVVGLVLGAVGGAILGGAIGVAAYDSCGCNDPTFRGIAIGAPIGAAFGGLVGYALVR